MSSTVEISALAKVKDHENAGRGVFASALIPAGTEIFSIPDPLICVPDELHLNSVCHYCLTETTDGFDSVGKAYKLPATLSFCLGCRVVKYCSKKCQAADWKHKGHSYECAIYKARYPRILPPTARVILRMAKLFLGETISANKTGGIGALKAHVAEFGNAGGERWEMMNLTAKAMSEFSKGSKKASFEPEFMRDLYCKMMVNSSTVTTEYFDGVGIAVDYNAAMLNHSCDPNAVMLFEGRKLTVRSTREIPTDTEITISYIDSHMTRKQRKAELKDRYFFDCSCSLCSTEPQPLESTLCFKCDGLVPQAASKCPTCSEPVSEDIDAAVALAAEIDATRSQPRSDMTIPTTLRAIKSLYATKLLPSSYYPIPKLHVDIAASYIAIQDWKNAFLHLAALSFKVYPVVYATPFHPVRVMRTFGLAMVLLQVAVVSPESFGAELDYSKLVYGLLYDVCYNVDKSHGAESEFARTVKRKMEEVKVDMRIDSNDEASQWMNKGLKGVQGLPGEVNKIFGIVKDFLEELSK